MIKKFLVLVLLGLSLTMFPKAIAGSDVASNVVVLTKSNLLVLKGEVNSESVGKLILQAREMDDLGSTLGSSMLGNQKSPLYLYLNTPGGSIQAGLQLIEALNGLDRKVNTITSFAASMGFQIAQNLGDRLILKSGVLMSHHARGGIEGDFGGVSTQLDSRYKLWSDRIKELDLQTIKRTNGKQTYESYIEDYDHEMWRTGTQSVEAGYADRIVIVRCDKTLTGTSKYNVNFMGIEINYELDNCPINQDPIGASIGELPPTITTDMAELIKKRFLENYSKKHYLEDYSMEAKIPKPFAP